MKKTILSLLISLLIFPLCLFALEGSRGIDAGQTAPPTTPSPAERQAELAARAKAMQDLKKSFAERLTRSVTPDQNAAVQKTMDRVYKEYGWVPEIKMFWGRRDIQALRENQDKVPEGLLKALVQLKNDLADRGIDLIFIPYPPTPFFEGHLVTDGVGPTDEYYPGWTKMLQQLVENDIEVIDPLDEFRAEAGNDLLINWVDDFHTASRGRQIAAKLLAERLQRYDFIRSLPDPKGAWTEVVKTGDHWEFYGRISQVNGMATRRFAKGQTINGKWTKPSLNQLFSNSIPEHIMKVKGNEPWLKDHDMNLDGVREVWYLQSDVPVDEIKQAVKDRPYRYLELKPGPTVDDATRARFELVHIGDSQLHTALFGSGLPEFYAAESGALFRWGSKSWSGFDPPAIYQEVVGNGPAPRVVVLSSLVKYFYSNNYGPRPLPKVNAAKSTLPEKSFTATIRITGISKQKDPSKLDYDEALAHNSAVIVGGPYDGKEIGIRYWTMYKGENIARAALVKPGIQIQVTLQPWADTIAADRKLGEHMVFDDVEQDLIIPVYWIQKGALDSKSLIGK